MSEDIFRVFDLFSLPSGCIHWTAKSPLSRAAVGAYACNAHDFLTALQKQEGWDCYFNLNASFHARVKPAKEQMTALNCIGLDIDPFPGQPLDMAATSEELLRLTSELVGHSRCCSIVNSGRGMWLWLFVTTTHISASFPLEDADLLVKAVTRWYVDSSPKLRSLGIIDTASAEVSRIARCPGTVNMKTKKAAYILWDQEPIERVPLPRLGHLIPEYRSKYLNTLSPTDLGLSDTSVLSIAPAMNITSRTFLLCGVDHATESRHRRLFSTAKNLRELGVSQQDAAPILALGASRCQPNLLLTNPEALPAILKSVWRGRLEAEKV